MAIAAVLAGLNAIGSVASGVQSNQNRQKAKSVINRAYELGRQRLTLRQGDQAQVNAERLGARGLAPGVRLTRPPQAVGYGSGLDAAKRDSRAARNAVVRATRAPVTPMGPSRMRRIADASRGVADADAAVVDARTRGEPEVDVTTARTLGEQNALDLAHEQQLEQNAMREQARQAKAGVDAGYAQSLVGTIGNGIGSTLQIAATPYGDDAAFGVDPVDPLRRGAWAQPAVDRFTIFNQTG